MGFSHAGIQWNHKTGRAPRFVSWSTAAYIATGHRRRLSAPRFERMVHETRAAFAAFMAQQQPHLPWENLDRIVDAWRACVTGGGRLLVEPGALGCAARTYQRMGWLERLAVLDVHLNVAMSPWAWLLRVAILEYCTGHSWSAPSWPAPRWPLNAPQEHGNRGTVLHECIRSGQLWAAERLLTWGAEVNVVDQTGATPLHQAARLGMNEAVAVLLSCGAAPNPMDADGLTPLDAALTNHDLGSSLLLLREGATSPLLAARLQWLRVGAEPLEDPDLLAVLDRLMVSSVLPNAPPAPCRPRL